MLTRQILNQLEQCLDKTVLIGLSYFDADEKLLEQKCLGGVVASVDKEKGIAIKLAGGVDKAAAEFILPSDLSCWFIAPNGVFPAGDTKVTDPDYLVTWDIYQTKKDKGEGEQQWWEWVPRTTPPQVG